MTGIRRNRPPDPSVLLMPRDKGNRRPMMPASSHKEEIMLRILVPAAGLVLGLGFAQPASAQIGIDLVIGAVSAQGGAAALNAAKTTIIKGEAKHWEPGQSTSPTG